MNLNDEDKIRQQEELARWRKQSVLTKQQLIEQFLDKTARDMHEEAVNNIKSIEERIAKDKETAEYFRINGTDEG